LFKENLNLCVLTERRVFNPYGLEGGGQGSNGINTLIRSDGLKINLGSKSEIDVKQGDVFRLETPGGGGFGCLDSNFDQKSNTDFKSNSNKVNLITGSLHNHSQIQNSA
jgi:5-oxoprolinase (ATP-hydrolysing)